MKGFSDTCTVELPVLADYETVGDYVNPGLVIYNIRVAGGETELKDFPEIVREAVITQLQRSIRAYEEERKTLPDMLGKAQ